MMKEILTPLADYFLPDLFNVRVTQFRLGPFDIEFLLKDNNYIPREIVNELNNLHDHRTGEKFIPKRFVLMCFVNDREGYLIADFDDQREAWLATKYIIQKLKFGEQVEIEDKLHINSPLRISYKGVEWIW